jgi:PmbA protein
MRGLGADGAKEFRMPQDLSRLTEALLAAATKAGATDADAIAIGGTSLSIDVRAGALEQAERSEGIDIGLRVLIGQRQACVSASDISADTIAQMAERAVAMAREAPEDPHIGLAEPGQLASATDAAALDLFDPAPEPAPAALEEAARRTEAAALALDGIAQVQAASAAYGRRRIHLSATNGFSGGYQRSDSALSCVAITGEGLGMERDYASEVRIYAADLPSPEEVGTEAAQRALLRAGARRPKTGAYPVIFDERVAGSLIGHLTAAINGMAIARGASWARDLRGERILPAGIDLVEEPHRPRTGGSRPFDAEGLATRERKLVEDGILTGWVLDLATARQLGLESTANAGRGPSAPPSPSLSNLTLTPGRRSREDLCREIGTGLLVTSFIGATVNPTTGDWSRGASGLWVENGEPAYAVNECTLAGNLREMLPRIVPADDARPHASRRIPSLLVEGLTLAGAG